MPGILVITGGSWGIGAAIAAPAAAAGWGICLSDVRRADRAAEVVRTCVDAGVPARAVRADVSAPADVAALFAAAEELGPVAGLVNNAGVLGPRPPWRCSTRTGSAGCWRSTCSGRSSVPPRRCGGCPPGTAAGRVDRLAGAVPLGRGGEAAEVAEAVVWLLSGRVSYVTGTTLDVSAAGDEEEVRMGRYDSGDRVLVTRGTFAGERGVVVSGDGLVGSGIEVALAGSGRRIDTEVDHVEPTDDGWRSRVQAGESVIVAEGDFKGEIGVVVGDSGLVGQRIVVRLDGGREIETRESHVSPVRR